MGQRHLDANGSIAADGTNTYNCDARTTGSAASSLAGRVSCNNCNSCAPPAGQICTTAMHLGTHNVLSGHHHLFKMNQDPGTCTCRWQPVGPQVGIGVVFPPPFWAIPCPFTNF